MNYEPIDKQDLKQENETITHSPIEECVHLEEPQQLLDSMHYNNFENLLVAMESFLQGFEICDHSMDFKKVASVLGQAESAFAQIDRNHDQSLSYKELLNYINLHPEVKDQFEWLLCHYDALTKSSLLPHDGTLHSRDLHRAANMFAGLDYVQRHFKSIARSRSDSQKIYPEDLMMLICSARDITPEEARGIWSLIRYVLKLGGIAHKSIFFTASDLAELTPEKLWNDML
jgi:hypothetical protein